MNIDTNRLFKDIEYKILLIEYHNFVSYVLNDINSYSIHSSSVKFNEQSILYKNKEEFMDMIKNTFKLFDVTFETYLDEDDLDEGEFSISVNWKNEKK